MTEGQAPVWSHPLPGNGRYRVLALSPDPHYSAGNVIGYVVTLAGDRVHEEPTLALALAWVQQRIAQERRMDGDSAGLPARRTPLRH